MKKGFVYTMFSIVVVSSIMLVLFVNMGSTRQYSSKSIEKIRADEVHYLVEGIEKDIERSGEISGRRSLLSIINWEITNGTFVADSEDAVTEAIINGTVNGEENLVLMENNTLNDWMETLDTLANSRGITTDISIGSAAVSMYAPFSVHVLTNASTEAKDEIIEVAYKRNITYSNAVSIENLEDPYITVKSYAYTKQNFVRCKSLNGGLNSADWAYGFAYISDEADLVGVSGKADKILVTQTIAGKLNFNGFAAVVSESNDISVSPPYVFSVANARNAILNNSLIVVDNETVWLTNITNQPNSSCYFNDRNGPSFLSRLEGKDTPDVEYGIAAFIHVPSLPEELRSGSKTYVRGYEYFENLFY